MSRFEKLPNGLEPRLRIHLPVRPVDIPADLLAAPPDSTVRYEHGTSCGISGSAVAKAADLIEEIGATIARQGQGRFHPDEAAHVLAEAQGIDSRALLKRMGDAFRTGRLIVREFDSDLQKGTSESWGKTGDIVFVTDVNCWLASQGVDYRFPKLEDRSCGAPTVDVQTPATVHPPLLQMMFDRLLPVSADFRGGRIADVDLLQLGEAAIMASRHSGADVTVQDILRTAARGEIPLKAIVHRRAKVFRNEGGVCINPGHPTDENVVPAGSIVTLPLLACQHLANAGRASWRVFEGFEIIELDRWSFEDHRLTTDETDFETAVEDCRITGYDLHAVADAFLEDETGNKVGGQGAVAASVPTGRRPSWYDVSISYVVDQMQKHRFSNAKELFYELFESAGTEASPFDRGTGNHRGKLIVRDISRPVSVKTLQNRWTDIRRDSRTA